jgi:hypothetical protein
MSKDGIFYGAEMGNIRHIAKDIASAMGSAIAANPVNACLNPVHFRQRLQALCQKEIDGALYVAERHLTLIE